MPMYDPRDDVARFLREMAREGVEVTVIWSKGDKGQASSNQGAEGIAKAAAALTIKGDALTRAGKALHAHMLAPAPIKWSDLDEKEQESIRTMCKVVIAAALAPPPAAPRILRPV